MYYVPQQHAPVAQFAPQGWVGDMISNQAPLLGGAMGGFTTELSGHPALGGIVGGATTMLARDYGHLLPFQAGPAMAAPAAYAPQGFWGDMISNVGGAVGHVVGGNTGNIIRDVSGLGQYLPFNAGPAMAAQPAAYAPQGIFGRIGGGLLGGAIGGAFGNRNLGSAIGGAVGNFLPFEAGPMQAAAHPAAYAPQGFWGDMISNVGGAVGGVVGGNTGNIIRDVSGLGQYLPFNAGPVTTVDPAYAPQGIFGRIGGGLLGGAIGGAFGNRNLGSAIGGAVGNFLPFQAGPSATVQPAAYAPQGFWGNMISNVGGAVGQVVGGRTGNIIRDASSLGQYLPFQAGPAMAAPAAYAPQGFWGDMISNVGGAVGHVVGGNTGNIIRDVSGLGQYLPFNAGPMMAPQPVAYAPQGIFGGIGGGLLGGAIGGALGNRNLGSAIGGAIGAFLPFQAGPGQPIQYIPVADMQAPAPQAAPAQSANTQVVYH